MKYIRANRHDVDQLLVIRWDRFSRFLEGSLSTIRKLKKLAVEVQATEQPVDFDNPHHILQLAIYLANQEVENRQRSINTKRGMRQAMREGRWVTRPPYGYQHARDAEDHAIIVPDPDQADLIREAFRMAARTSLALEEIRRRLRKKGLKVKRARFPDLLRNPVYVGKIHIKAWDGEPEEIVEGLHEALISERLFREVQQKRFEIDDPRSVRSRRLHERLPLRGHLLCPACLSAEEEQLLTGSGSRGRSRRYWYYHCHNERGGETCGHRFRAESAHETFKGFLAGLEIAPEVRSLYRHVVEDVATGERKKHRQIKKKAKREVDSLEERLLQIDEKYAFGKLPEDSYHRLKGKYDDKLRKARLRLEEATTLTRRFSKHLNHAIELISDLERVYREASIEGKDALTGSIFPGHLVFEDGVFRTAQKEPIIALLSGEAAKIETPTGEEPSASRKAALPGFEPGTP